MIDLVKLVRPNILKVKQYSSARDEYSGKKAIFLDANENPNGKYNRYPDPHQHKLKVELAKLKSIDVDNIFIGNGSDEIIDLTLRVFCNPGLDKAMVFSPTYGMYAISAAINDVELIEIKLNADFQINIDAIQSYLLDPSLKLIFICSPNNPTGNSINNIEQIIKSFGGIVIIDEAYIDYSTHNSWINEILKYPNLIVTQTFSKAWGLAAARVGIAYSSTQITSLLDKIKPPYNVSSLNQNAALKALKKNNLTQTIKITLKEKRKIIRKLNKMKIITKIFPSDTNFILVQCIDADQIYNYLVQHKIIVRNRNSVVKDCIRITIGTPLENNLLIKTLSAYEKNINPGI